MTRSYHQLLGIFVLTVAVLFAPLARSQNVVLTTPTEIPDGPPLSSYVNELGITISEYAGGITIRTDASGNILPSPEQCIASKESGNQFGICNGIGYCGPNQMGVSSYMSSGFCQMMPPSQVLVLNGTQGCVVTNPACMVPCDEGTYHACNMIRNVEHGLDKNQQHWEDCVWTAAAISAAAQDGITLQQPNQINPPAGQTVAQVNMAQLQASQTLQQQAMNAYFGNMSSSAINIYNQSLAANNGVPININGIPMTSEVIMYLVNAAGAGSFSAANWALHRPCGRTGDGNSGLGAMAYVMTFGYCKSPDTYFNYDLDDTARKMFNCLMGMGTC